MDVVMDEAQVQFGRSGRSVLYLPLLALWKYP